MSTRLSLLTLFVFTTLAVIVRKFILKTSIHSAFTSGYPMGIQFLAGLIAALIPVSISIILMVKTDFFHQLQKFSEKIFNDLNPDIPDIIFLSLSSGWGEELFFRGALQPLLSLIPTSLVFAFLHSGYKLHHAIPRQYFLIATTLGLVLGILTQYIGLVSAMVFHTVWNMATLFYFKFHLKTPGSATQEINNG